MARVAGELSGPGEKGGEGGMSSVAWHDGVDPAIEQ